MATGMIPPRRRGRDDNGREDRDNRKTFLTAKDIEVFCITCKTKVHYSLEEFADDPDFLCHSCKLKRSNRVIGLLEGYHAQHSFKRVKPAERSEDVEMEIDVEGISDMPILLPQNNVLREEIIDDNGNNNLPLQIVEQHRQKVPEHQVVGLNLYQNHAVRNSAQELQIQQQQHQQSSSAFLPRPIPVPPQTTYMELFNEQQQMLRLREASDAPLGFNPLLGNPTIPWFHNFNNNLANPWFTMPNFLRFPYSLNGLGTPSQGIDPIQAEINLPQEQRIQENVEIQEIPQEADIESVTEHPQNEEQAVEVKPLNYPEMHQNVSSIDQPETSSTTQQDSAILLSPDNQSNGTIVLSSDDGEPSAAVLPESSRSGNVESKSSSSISSSSSPSTSPSSSSPSSFSLISSSSSSSSSSSYPNIQNSKYYWIYKNGMDTWHLFPKREQSRIEEARARKDTVIRVHIDHIPFMVNIKHYLKYHRGIGVVHSGCKVRRLSGVRLKKYIKSLKLEIIDDSD